MHGLCSVKYGQAYPPKVAAVVTLRDRLCDPVPHDFVHAVQALKPDTTQCPAQLCVLQARVSSRWLHGLPPEAAVVTLRLRLCDPVPHDCVHVVQSLKTDSSQCPGQACVLHARCSSK